MKQYESIWIKSDVLPKPTGEGFLASLPVLEEKKGPLNCMTIEEVKELWELASQRGCHIGQYGNYGIYPRDLNEYLQSKEINI